MKMPVFLKKWNIRITFCIVLILISLGTILNVHAQIIQSEKIRYQNNMEEETAKIFLYFSSDFQNMIKSGNAIFSSLWYSHLRNPAGIYDQEFHVVRRNEISQELKNRLLSIKFAENFLVITPDYVISKDGWFSHAQYKSYYNEVNILNENSKISITKQENNIYPLIIEEPYKKINAGVVCILLDGQKLKEMLESILPENLSFCQIAVQGKIVYQTGSRDNGLIYIQQEMNNPDTILEIGFPSYQSIYGISNFIDAIIFTLADLLICIMLSFLLSRIAVNPLRRLIRQFNGNICDDPYQQIRALVQNFFDRNEQLCRETNHLNRSIQQIVQYTQKEVLLNMLTNPDFNFQNDLILFYIPCINSGDPFFFLVIESKNEDTISCLSVIKSHTKFSFSFPVLQRHICLFLWFDQIDAARKSQEKLTAFLINHPDKPHFSCSDILLEPGEIHENYCAIAKELEKSNELSCELPLTIQMELVQYFYNGSIDKFLKVSQNFWNEYTADAFFSFLFKLTSEIMDESPLNPIPHTLSWNTYEQQVQTFYKETAVLQKKNKDTTGQVICDYIAQHFCEEDMCLKKLTDIFGIHRTLISKMIKSYTGKSFSDYLLDLRIEQATKLLHNSDLAITAITEKIGYTNYTTFKRAFIRAMGLSPREYREKIQQEISDPFFTS